jgi:hypothetical protein
VELKLESCLGEERLIGKVETGLSEAMALDIYTTLPPAQTSGRFIRQRLPTGKLLRLK